jgi:Recombinase-like helix-turn-helix domain
LTERRQQIEAFVRRLVVEVEAAEAAGKTTPDAIADHFNAKGITTRKGRRWTGATVAKFLGSPGAKRYRSDRNVR